MEPDRQGPIGSMGSQYASFRVPLAYIPRMAGLDWNSVARRVFIDPVNGLIALVSPSSEHEGYARGADGLVREIGRAYGFRTVLRGSTRWRRPGDPENTGAEPDACYYLGKTAEAWRLAYREGRDALAAFEAETPPDLVVEVERSPGDEGKPGFYPRTRGSRDVAHRHRQRPPRGRYPRPPGSGRSGFASGVVRPAALHAGLRAGGRGACLPGGISTSWTG